MTIIDALTNNYWLSALALRAGRLTRRGTAVAAYKCIPAIKPGYTKRVFMKSAKAKSTKKNYLSYAFYNKSMFRELPVTAIQKLDGLVESVLKQLLRHNTFMQAGNTKSAAGIEKSIYATTERIEAWLERAFQSARASKLKGVKIKTKTSRFYSWKAEDFRKAVMPRSKVKVKTKSKEIIQDKNPSIKTLQKEMIEHFKTIAA